MIASRESLTLAVRNVALWGDTDVLPFPIENHWFHDDEDGVVDLLGELDANFDDWMANYPLLFERSLSGVGYVGFRGTTQIDPIWNAYLLALVIELGEEIERRRLPIESHKVFSYRFRPDSETSSLFDRDIGWAALQSHALLQARNFGFVLSTDISDFYPRVYHHRIENALKDATNNKEAARRVCELLKALSTGGVSYGLPVGGNAARLLAELLLSRTDHLLNTKGVNFCRFVDDYYLFADSEEEARRSLVYLSDKLLTHEGLTLQRSKTRLMTQEEFVRNSPVRAEADAESEEELQAQNFLRLRLKYDPYSPTSDEDYDRLCSELSRFDIVGMLARELRKSRVDETLVRQLVKSIKYLDPELRDAAVESLVQNLNVLYPVFPTVALVVTRLISDLSAELRERLFKAIRHLIREGSYIFLVPANLCFALRLLVHDPSAETDILLTRLYDDQDSSMMLKRDLILCLARRGEGHWIADVIRRSSTLTQWERRALIPASYILGDEGKHWRGRTKRTMHEVDKHFTAWVGSKNTGRLWQIPL